MTAHHKNKPLNRTIVGWKLAEKDGLGGVGPPLNRTIVGWKLSHRFIKHNPPAPLNRTIVGWKPKGLPHTGF